MTHRAQCPLPSRAVDAWTRHLRSRYTQGDGLDYSACGRVTIALLPLANGTLRWSSRYFWRRGSSKSLSWRSGATRQDAVAIARRDELSKGPWPHVDGPAALRQLFPSMCMRISWRLGPVCIVYARTAIDDANRADEDSYRYISEWIETILEIFGDLSVACTCGSSHVIMSSCKNQETDT